MHTAVPLLTLVLAGAPMSVHEFTVKSNAGADVALSAYAGKVLLIVNTASQCGYTPQYAGLEALYQQYRGRGLEILAFPSNDFGAQEPGSDADIKKFCELKFRTTFPLFAKVPVKGPSAAPLYKFLTAQKASGKPVSWNFNKFLVDGKGQVVAHLDSSVEPGSPELAKQLEALLPKK
jgi:glutathione peroxidase